MKLRRFFAAAVLDLALVFCARAQEYGDLPREIYVEQGKNHVQGIEYDAAAGKMYFSFTTSFVVTDLHGKVIGSIDRIQGHLGDMTFDAEERKVYASLECKDDEVGASLSAFAKGNSKFYVAVIDVDKVTETGMDSEDNEAFKVAYIHEATKDYNSVVSHCGKELRHAYGCSGIDGVAIAPKAGRSGGKNFLYVAYGIYSDTARTDNDYQVLLRYDMRRLASKAVKVKFGSFYSEGLRRPAEKYFVFTGNTAYGVQNLAYDSSSGKMLMAVYRGQKSGFANFSHFAFDIAVRPKKDYLQGVDYENSRHAVIASSGEPVQEESFRRDGAEGGSVSLTLRPVPGFSFKYGSTGMCPIGDGLVYLSQNGRNPDNGKEYCRAVLYRWDPFSLDFIETE